MATALAPTTTTTLPIHRLELETYNRMVASGALEGEPVELLEGLLVEMSPQEVEHALIVEGLTRHFSRAEARLRVQLPLEVPPDSVPEPDLALVAEKSTPRHHPRTALLAVEVAVSSRKVDRGVKAVLYARAGVPQYWVVNVPDRCVEVRTDPAPDGYRSCKVYKAGASVPSPDPGADDLDVRALFGEAGD
jgi:Uma2 family endonuclease